VPAEIAPFVSMVADLLQFPALPTPSVSLVESGGSNRSLTDDATTDGSWPDDCGKICAKSGLGGSKVTPAVLARRYNLGSPPVVGTTNGSIAVAEFTGVFWDQRDLDEFQTVGGCVWWVCVVGGGGVEGESGGGGVGGGESRECVIECFVFVVVQPAIQCVR
jgi:hypothetical protein